MADRLYANDPCNARLFYLVTLGFSSRNFEHRSGQHTSDKMIREKKRSDNTEEIPQKFSATRVPHKKNLAPKRTI